MSSGKNPLMLMMALSMPGAANAIGLGDIHVDSGLNERLAAEIDIVGATALELADLQAAVANRETFLRYGMDRPAFLSSATFKVTQDSRGRPVLAVRSSESFTEPLVNFLVDLRWNHGELVRQYTLLLDPPGLAAANRPAEASPVVAAATIASTPIAPTPIASTPIVPAGAARKTTHIKVGAKATLRGIAWRAGERSDPDLQKMMIAIFRANPSAFDGNINRLHRGAILTIPSRAQAATLSNAEAKREVHAQMAAWHAAARTAAPREAMKARPGIEAASSTAAAPGAAPASSVASASSPESASSSAAPLDHSAPASEVLAYRVQSLEQELSNMKGLLQSEQNELVGLERRAAGKSAPPRPTADAPPAQRETGYYSLPAIIAGLGLLGAALGGLHAKFCRRTPVPRHQGDPPVADAAADAVVDDTSIAEAHTDDATHPMLPILPAAAVAGPAATAGRSEAVPEVDMRADTVNMRMEPTRLDYNLLDLDLTAQHVQMPSMLNEHAVVKERRTNLADVLRLAIEREPDRHDLRMKLLELYYAAAATNRKAFLEVVQKFARDRDYLQAEQWDKIAYMGRQIAAENPLFAEASAADDDLADCA